MGIRRISYFAHSLNLVVTDTIKTIPELQDARDKVCKFETKTKQSTVAKEKLEKLQENLGKKPKKLLQDVPMHWNSVCLSDELQDSVTLFLPRWYRGLTGAWGILPPHTTALRIQLATCRLAHEYRHSGTLG